MLKSLLDITTSIHEVEVEFANGEKEKLFIKELTAVEIASYINALNSDDPNVKSKANVEFIANALCDSDGKQLLTKENATKIKAKNMNAFAPILDAIAKVNGMSDEKKS